ncbi:tetraspanin-1 [Chanos chanos]|uniref:Tetraspanin n=1 Tax=Chanos chanos TaxID=29144 RepID=A0A6J2WR45_CHACN|nr:tetraspanin-1 [Chanos chanos]
MACLTFVKVMMVAFNLLIFLGGGNLLAVGIWVTVDGGTFLKVIGPFPEDPVHAVNVGFFCIATGGVLVLLGLLGCCGVQKESRCLLVAFFSIILIIFIAEVAAGVMTLAFTSLSEDIFKTWAGSALQTQYGKDRVVTGMWNSTMTELKCCGLTNYTDFTNSYYYNTNHQSYPPSCCLGNTTSACREEDAQANMVPGCFEQLLVSMQRSIAVIGGIALGVCALELAAMVMSMCLYVIWRGQEAEHCMEME